MAHDQDDGARLSESAGAVFAVLAAAGSATRPQLAALAGLSKPTVSAAVAELETASLAARSGTAHGATGRSAAVYRLGPAAGCVLAVDLGSTHTEVRGCALDGTVLTARATDGRTRPADALRDVLDVLDELSAGSPRAVVVAVPDVATERDGSGSRPATPGIAGRSTPSTSRPASPSTSRTTSTAPPSPNSTRAPPGAATPSDTSRSATA